MHLLKESRYVRTQNRELALRCIAYNMHRVTNILVIVVAFYNALCLNRTIIGLKGDNKWHSLDFEVKKPYKRNNVITAVVKPSQTRPATPGRKGSTGYCVSCSAVATKEALFKLEGAIVIQRYCNKCLPKADYKIT